MMKCVPRAEGLVLNLVNEHTPNNTVPKSWPTLNTDEAKLLACKFKAHKHKGYWPVNLVGLLGFYDISTILDYLMPNPAYIYTK